MDSYEGERERTGVSGLTGIEAAEKIARATADIGGRCFYVGGYVRDCILGKESKDIDIEVHGIECSQLEAILDECGGRMSMGESFGIYGLKGVELDIAMPRKEKVTGRGHKDFSVFVDPYIGTRKAAERRDFTVNALMRDVLTGEVIDHFGGLEDLKRGVLRHVNPESFAEDPLRVLRACRFSARFGFKIAPETVELCRGMDISALPSERVFGELEKALLKAERPSVFFLSLREMGQLGDWFAELEPLIGLKQSPVHHPEGDVWNHTMKVLDEAAKLRERARQPLYFMFAALCHDLGKAVTTQEINGAIHAYMHETEGVPLIESFIGRLTREKALLKYVRNMSELHMRPNMIAQGGSSDKAFMHLFDDSVEPEDLLLLSRADYFGSAAAKDYSPTASCLREKLDIYYEIMSRPRVQGADLIEAGFTPGKAFSEAMLYARKLALAGVDKKAALPQVISYIKKVK